MIRNSIPALVAIFKALLYIKGQDIPKEKRAIVRNTCEAVDIDLGIFEKLLDIKEGKSKPGGSETGEIFKGYLVEMRKLSKRVDALGG
ncbi:MAG: hypothetical protein JRJ20_08200 [Deltaproteobacteria bacterium]|nr:hypothetical protein [Deltaproteobacteria bacterium]